ncbi:MAG: TorF family putative porin [Pseudomonadota bacterium]
MKKLILASVVAGAFAVPSLAHAQDSAGAESPHSFSGNFALVSDYRFRGISQTDRDPGIQGGFDYEHASGFYIGNWNASVTTDLFNGGAGLEMDLYAGYRGEVEGFSYDIGVLQYYYPGAKVAGTNTRYDTTELYIGAGYGPISAKIWYGVSDKWFASKDAKGSIYYELNGEFPLSDKLSLVAHVGYQDVKDTPDADYFDYKLGLTYDLQGWALSAAVIGTDADDDVYGNLGDTTVVLSVGKSF